MIGFQKMAIYFKIVSVVCKAVSVEHTEDKTHIFAGFQLLAQVQKRIKTVWIYMMQTRRNEEEKTAQKDIFRFLLEEV